MTAERVPSDSSSIVDEHHPPSRPLTLPLATNDIAEIAYTMPVGVFVVDHAGSPCYANATAIALLGKGVDGSASMEELPELYQAFVSGTDDLYPAEQLPVVRGLLGEYCYVDDVEIRSPTGSRQVEVWGSPLFDQQGSVSHGVAIFADISARKLAEDVVTDNHDELARLNADLVRSNADLDQAQLLAQVGSWEVDLVTGGVRWSRELARCFELDSDLLPSYEALVERTHPADREKTVAAIELNVSAGSSFDLEHRLQLPSGAVRWISSRGRVEVDESGAPLRILGTAQDITDQRNAQDALDHLATHDSLTGLPNRADILARLTIAIQALVDPSLALGVIYLDIDRFHLINDSLGLPIGDELLIATAARITAALPAGLTLARIGGDEFAVLYAGEREIVDVRGLADTICAAMTAPVEWAGGHLVMSVSAGVALATSPTVAPHELLRDANAAMYVAKRSGRARSALFEETMRTKAVARLETEVALRRSIADGDLRVHYQQIVTLDQGRPVGHEALVRWNHPKRGLVAPDEFITIAEETGLIVPLGAWVLRGACMQARRFQCLAPQWARLTMSVNLSGGQLNQPDLVEMIAAALRDTDLRSEHLQLEMTESVLMGDAAATITVLQRLKGLGVKLGVDDFGTGYSSLAYLRRFPVDVLKIDRTFVDGLGKDLEDSAVAAAVVSLADTLGFTTVAEGVETELQRDCLLGLGCERAQGYLFARPVPSADAEAALTNASAQPR